MHDIYREIVMLLIIAAAIGAVAIRLRQPLVIGFIAVGVLAGPSVLNWIQGKDQLHLMAEMGLAMLLFVVGLRLDLQLIRSMGVVALVAGLGQVVATALVGFLLALLLGQPLLTALYIALALTFSSTIIVVKLLSDKHEAESLHGRIALGILIVQDLVVIIAMMLLSAAGGEAQAPPAWLALAMLGKGLLFLGGVWAATFLLLPRLLPLLARSTELLVLFAIAWALLLAFLGDALGFGKEVGAFLAGVSLASTMYREILAAKLVSLRDFLLLFFFIEMGSRLDLSAMGGQLVTGLVLSAFVLVGKPVLIMLLLAAMGYRKRTSFMTGVSLAQISEFSLILAAMGAQAGYLSAEVVGMITLVALITIGGSSSLIQYAQGMYERLSPHLRALEWRARHREDAALPAMPVAPHVILFGIGRYGTSIAEELVARGRGVLGVDFDPQAVSAWTARGWPAVFGDAEDPDFAESLPLATAGWVVSAIRDPRLNRALAKAMRHAGYRGNLAFTVSDRAEGDALLAQSPGLLLVPFEDAAVQAVDLLYLTEDRIARETMDTMIASMSQHFVICGYGRMGQQIAKDFLREGVPFVVVEDNPEQLPRLREQNILHIVGPSSNDEVLQQAGIARARGLIAVASTDEANVFIVLTARGINPGLYIVARSIREENEDKLRRAGADRVMSPYILGGRRMAAAVTKPGVMDFLDLVLHSEHFNTDIAHITVPPGSPGAGRSLESMQLWQACGVSVLAVQRPGEELYANPCPDFVIQAGDDLIVMGSPVQIAGTARFLATEPVPDAG
jgi:Kef-type K+ transport system membrane component KefB/Trk K+ transport system NAD-binding subunit